jgi:hypothetical protein
MDNMNDLKNNKPNVEFSSQGSLDAFVDGKQIIDTDYTANLSNGILDLETSSNGNTDSKNINVRDLFENMSRRESLKSILSELYKMNKSN